MKKTLIILGTLFCLVSVSAHAEPEKKKTCVTSKDAKTGKMKEQCKVVKIHKKLEGTAVPDKKK